MLRASIVLFVLALVAGFFGFWGLEATAAWMAKLLFIAFLVMAAVTFMFGRRAEAV